MQASPHDITRDVFTQARMDFLPFANEVCYHHRTQLKPLRIECNGAMVNVDASLQQQPIHTALSVVHLPCCLPVLNVQLQRSD